jgi:hypothetical protein
VFPATLILNDDPAQSSCGQAALTAAHRAAEISPISGSFSAELNRRGILTGGFCDLSCWLAEASNDGETLFE